MENFRIESLEINKIGAFEHIKMDFPKKTAPDKAEIHILTGENGTGKSTVLEVLSHSQFTPNLTLRTNSSRLLKKSHSNEAYFKIENNSPYSIKFDVQEEVPSENSEKTDHTAISEVNFSLFAYSGYRRVSETRIEGPRLIHDSALKDSLDFDKSINAKNLTQWIVNTVTSALNSKGRGDDKKAEKFRESLKQLEDIISEITDRKISIDIDDNWNVLIIDERYLNFDVLPDGLKSMISWIGDLLMRMDRIKWKDDLPIFDRNFILFLDEIEVHLHPAWQRKILPVIQKLFKNAQIFISTHSPFVVGSVDGAWVHKLKKGDDGFAVLDGEPVLSEDGKSVRRILDEIFGINQQYGVEVEKDLARFREIRQQIIMGQTCNSEEFNDLVKHLASQSTELEQMMGMEMNQLKRITQKELV